MAEVIVHAVHRRNMARLRMSHLGARQHVFPRQILQMFLAVGMRKLSVIARWLKHIKLILLLAVQLAVIHGDHRHAVAVVVVFLCLFVLRFLHHLQIIKLRPSIGNAHQTIMRRTPSVLQRARDALLQFALNARTLRLLLLRHCKFAVFDVCVQLQSLLHIEQTCIANATLCRLLFFLLLVVVVIVIVYATVSSGCCGGSSRDGHFYHASAGRIGYVGSAEHHEYTPYGRV
mmetsp:Transcript_53207/g.84935  ORF Transcript_53207/g.84935 Transcript_53207/m.84935 type:complete len:231 (-) Transcript_53207:1118-1810(-)